MTELIRLSLPATIASLLGKRDHDEYRNVGQNMTRKDLASLLGLTANTMLTHYTSGKTKAIDPERAVVILDKFNILVNDWISPEQLREDVTNRELSAQIAREPIKKIIEEIVEIEANEEVYELRKGLRKLIARYY